MDIKNYKLQAPFKKLELGTYCIQKDVDKIIFPTNWTDSNPDDLSEFGGFELLDYWISIE